MAQPSSKDILAASADGRLEARKRVLMAGMVVQEGGADPFACTVLDVSASGARVRVGADRMVPSQFHLVVVRDRTAHKVQVMWRRQQLAGVRIESTHPIDQTLPDELRFLQRLWIECATR
ncbi:MAG TPA: PilZ domain-containing protein [Rhizomicrobium sp.]|nr:PilZ domain-containing protein [Rhizomicrobium sp.]